jgi:hypothetical protein
MKTMQLGKPPQPPTPKMPLPSIYKTLGYVDQCQLVGRSILLFLSYLVNVESFVLFFGRKKKTILRKKEKKKCSRRGENKQTSLKFFSFSSSHEPRQAWQARKYAGRYVGPVVAPAVQLPLKKIEKTKKKKSLNKNGR